MSHRLPISLYHRDEGTKLSDTLFFIISYPPCPVSFALFGFNNIANNGIIFHGWRLIVKETEKKSSLYNIDHLFVHRLMDNNRLLCIDEHAIKGLKDLEIL
jgi:hypothetical protein